MAVQKYTRHFDWDDIRIFMQLAECGTLSATARQLKINHATVARRLTQLESCLGFPLFHRKPEGYHLTMEGGVVREQALSMDAAAQAILAIRTDADNSLSGIIRVTATRTLSDTWLVRHMQAFQSRHQSITVDLISETRNASLAKREADIAVRLARPADSDSIGRHVATMRYGLFGREDIVSKFLNQEEVRFIGYDENTAIPEADWLDHFARGKRFALRTNSAYSQLQAARCGTGLAVLPAHLIGANNELVRVHLDHDPPPDREVWLLSRREILRIPRFRLMYNYLIAAFRADKDLFTNLPPARLTQNQ